ncbi:MAG: IPT/TIG domain-containing protein [Patescibacteria group bacterium]
MKKLINKNLIFVFAIFALILSFSLANTVLASTVTVGFGATNTLVSSGDVGYGSNNNTNTNNNNGNTNPNNNNNNNYQNTNQIPVITSISPSSATTGTSAKAITITGYNFIPSSVARWNGSDRDTTYISPNQLLMYTTSTDMKGLGNYAISVYNHTTNGGVSNVKTFTLNKKVAAATSTTKKPTATTTKKPAEPTCVAETDDSKNNLTASAIFGSDTFLPTSFLGWLLLFILIFLIVIIWRKLNRKGEQYQKEKKYRDPTELKHA